MRTRRQTTIEDLRRSIDCLPTRTKRAMLQGIETNPIIVGAYSTRDGICPMLAAHRAGGRTDLIAFARAWDRVALGRRRRAKPRRATERELLLLRSHLEYSLLQEEGTGALAGAIAEHRELMACRPAPDPTAGPQRRAAATPTAAAATPTAAPATPTAAPSCGPRPAGPGPACSAATTTTSRPSSDSPPTQIATASANSRPTDPVVILAE